MTYVNLFQYFIEIEFLELLKKLIIYFFNQGFLSIMVSFIKAYTNPEKYAVDLEIDKIIADKKVDIAGVQRYKDLIDSGVKTKSIVVVKHPKKEYYAVLDGHHRFCAYKQLGYSSIKSAVVEDFIGLGFYLTKEGRFQPDPKITKYIRIPLKRFNEFIVDFIEAPERFFNNKR